MKCEICGCNYYVVDLQPAQICGLCHMNIQSLWEGGDKVAEKGDGLNGIIGYANKRRFSPRDYPQSIVTHAQRVIDWHEHHEIVWGLDRFRQMFLDFGVARMGFANYVEKVIPVIHTPEEFAHLLQQMGYDVVTEDDRDPIRVFVSGYSGWSDSKAILGVLRALPDESTLYECGAAGAECMAAKLADQFEIIVAEEAANSSQSVRAFFENADPDILVLFDSAPKEHKRTMFLVSLAREYEVPIKIVTGTKKVDFEAWLEEVLDYDAEA